MQNTEHKNKAEGRRLNRPSVMQPKPVPSPEDAEDTKLKETQNMRREQLFETAHEAYVLLNNYTKHGWHGYVEQIGSKFKLVIAC